jgi:hypothetical protein
MNIKTDGPVEMCFSNANGVSQDTINTAIQTLGQVGSSLAQRQYTEVEQKCGKRPSLPGKRRKAWDACATEYAKSAGVAPSSFIPADIPSSQPVQTQTGGGKVPTWVWIVGGAVALGVVGFVIYRATKK